MAQLFSDENFSLRVVEILRSLGHDTLTTFEAGLANANTTDERIVAVATHGRRAVITYNRSDFRRIHLSGIEHAGIIICTRDQDVRRHAQRIHLAILANEPLDGKLIRVNRPGPSEDRT